MKAKELILGATLLAGGAFAAALSTSSATLAQGYYGYHHYYGHRYRGLYNYGGDYGYSRPDIDRGGPGPRVQGGSGMGIGAVR